MKNKVTNYQCRRTVRITRAEDERLREFAAKVGIPVSEYMRRLFFGGRPIIAKTDDLTIRELRRLGGLLKHNFGIISESGQQEAVREICKTLQAIQRMMDNLGGRNDPEEI
ncbi:plasmid mobilization protein [Desulfovibrio sp. SGI.169]|uniref:plasmid mobilization protein n=1 Tax=Desulfovibrio sp. SGI.169 TaxID=3420561 RepID=UPI003D013877